MAGAGLGAEVVEGAGLAAEVPEVAAFAVARDSPECGPVSLGADRVSVPECPGTFGAIAVFAMGAVSMMGSSSLVIRSFTVRITTATILTAIILTDIIRTATDMADTDTVAPATATGDTDTILTINPVTRALRPGGVPRSEKSRCVWRVQAITTARSTESWVLEHVMQSELLNARTIRA